jgi:hypothetical protein
LFHRGWTLAIVIYTSKNAGQNNGEIPIAINKLLITGAAGYLAGFIIDRLQDSYNLMPETGPTPDRRPIPQGCRNLDLFMLTPAMWPRRWPVPWQRTAIQAPTRLLPGAATVCLIGARRPKKLAIRRSIIGRRLRQWIGKKMRLKDKRLGVQDMRTAKIALEFLSRHDVTRL